MRGQGTTRLCHKDENRRENSEVKVAVKFANDSVNLSSFIVNTNVEEYARGNCRYEMATTTNHGRIWWEMFSACSKILCIRSGSILLGKHADC
ncbi:hypothetical protein RRG08_012414 [Elysia crispata]|uniref:Uncharacterized protein n=1 Tax=Elysia crispata TaxID=231223 RepID=A0AAE1CXL9_9GAST|nr:hypothetical protein RRG08_012414 [Elysia crispata]